MKDRDEKRRKPLEKLFFWLLKVAGKASAPELGRVNKLLKTCERLADKRNKKAFRRQRFRNNIARIIGMSPFLAALGLCLFVAHGQDFYAESFEKIYNHGLHGFAKSVKAIVGREETKKILEPAVLREWKDLSILLLVGFVPSCFISYFISSKSPFVKKSASLLKQLKKSGHHEQDADAVALWTPVGVLIEMQNTTKKPLLDDEKLWSQLNITPGVASQDPDKMDLIFISSGFALQKKYEYNATHLLGKRKWE